MVIKSNASIWSINFQLDVKTLVEIHEKLSLNS
jgi:hypothetical protein